jgi:hypothetical protein
MNEPHDPSETLAANTDRSGPPTREDLDRGRAASPRVPGRPRADAALRLVHFGSGQRGFEESGVEAPIARSAVERVPSHGNDPVPGERESTKATFLEPGEGGRLPRHRKVHGRAVRRRRRDLLWFEHSPPSAGHLDKGRVVRGLERNFDGLSWFQKDRRVRKHVSNRGMLNVDPHAISSLV